MYLKLLSFAVCYFITSSSSFSLFGQELLKNPGFEEIKPCELCQPYYGFRVREMLKNSWSFFIPDGYGCPEIFIWSGKHYENLACKENDAWKYKHHCSEIDLTTPSPLGERIIMTLCSGDFFQQKLLQKIKKGSICQVSAVFNLEENCRKDTLNRRISFFLSCEKPISVRTNKQRAAEAKRCNLKLIGEISLDDTLVKNTWYEKSFNFVADADYEYFFGGAPAITFFQPERDENLRICHCFFDRFSLRLIAAPISDELKKIAFSADSLSIASLYEVRGRFMRVKGAVFLKNSALPKSVTDLDKTASFLLKNPSLKIRIEGHTDEDGDTNSNLNLSEKRANAVKNYLVTKGIKAENIEIKGLGSTAPISKLKAENRRVEILFLE